jgi:hypothetical protein
MKHCYICKEEKSFDSFYNNKNKSSGKCDECIDCRKKMRNKNNPPKWIGKKIEMLTVLDFDKNTGKYKCVCDCGNETHVATANLNNNKTKSCGCYIKKDLQKTLERSVFSRYKTTAKKKNLEFNLKYYEFKKISESPCAYCGEIGSIKNIHKKYNQFNYFCNGIDRVDNSKGYTLENSVACCSWCNSMKNTHNVKDFIDKINKIQKHLTTNKEVLHV